MWFCYEQPQTVIFLISTIYDEIVKTYICLADIVFSF